VDELETIFATIPEEVRVFGPNGDIVRHNATARDAHGAASPSSVRLLWQADRPRTTDGQMIFLHEHPAARALAGESVRDAQFLLQRGGREVTLEVNAEPLRDENGQLRGAVTVERDVSERAALARAMAEQVKAREERLASVGRLAAGVVHDVNNVLNPILAAAFLAEQGAEDAASVREYTQRITMAAEMGVGTLARLRRFIRQEPFSEKDERTVDLAAVLDEVLMLAEPTWTVRPPERAIRVRRSLDDAVFVQGMPSELREAVLNLIQNAVDAMPDGGVLQVSVEEQGVDAVLTVRDSGVGMSPEVRERAFEPFYSTKGNRGTGLGLAEVYGIVKRHRGAVELETAVGTGTSVTVRIPLSAAR
jgi:signal transduction histidine kinase